METCNSIIHSGGDDLDLALQALERVAKATILGHLLPVLVTAMTHPRLHSLEMGDILMPQLVQLVVLTSQAALLLKSQVRVLRDNALEDENLVSEDSIYDILGDAINTNRYCYCYYCCYYCYYYCYYC